MGSEDLRERGRGWGIGGGVRPGRAGPQERGLRTSMDPKPQKTRRACNEPGDAHLLTYSCFRRLPLLTRNRTRRWVLDALAATRRRLGEYLEQTEDDTWLERLSVEYPSRRVFRFWQPGVGFDRNIFWEKTVPAVIDYIRANPVRRGLVERPTEWPWSSARFWDGWSDVPVPIVTVRLFTAGNPLPEGELRNDHSHCACTAGEPRRRQRREACQPVSARVSVC